MGSCFKFGKRKNTYRFTDPYSKSTPDGKYQLQDNPDLSSRNYVVPAEVPTTNTEVSQKNELRASTEENGVSPAVTNTTTEITTTTVTKRTTYTKSDDRDGDGPRVNGDITGDVAATAATAVVVAGAVDAVKPTEDEEDGNKQEEDTVAVMRETEDGEPERAENIYTYETSGEDSSRKLEEEPQTAEDEYEAISDAVTFSETQAYQAEAYEVAVTSSTVAVGQEDGVVDVSESDAYYSTPAEEDYYSTVAEPEDDAAVIVTTQSVVYENPPTAFDDEQHSHTAVSDELSKEIETAGLEDGAEDPTSSVINKATVITTSSTGEDSTANTTSRLSTDYEEGQGGYTTTTIVTTTELTLYNTEQSHNNDSSEQQSADSQDDSQRASVTVNYTTDGNDLHQQLTTTNSLECQTPTSGQFARNVDDYVLS